MPIMEYDYSTKLAVCQKIADGLTTAKLSSEAVGASLEQVYRWLRAYRTDGASGLLPRRKGRGKGDEYSAMSRIRDEMVKRGEVYGTLEEKIHIVTKYKHRFPICALCEFLGISKSTFYYRMRPNRKKVEDRDLALIDKIWQLKQGFRTVYGYRKVTVELRRLTGERISKNRVYRVMQKYNLLNLEKTKQDCRTRLQTSHNIFPNRIGTFEAQRPNQKWVQDVTKIITPEGVLYFAAVKDLFDSSVLGYAFSHKYNTDLVLSALERAVACCDHSGVCLHSDRGAPYCSQEYFLYVKSNQIVPSMSRPGTPRDNAPMESFFSRLKMECIYRARPSSRAETEQLVREYIEFYNKRRILSRTHTTPELSRLRGFSPDTAVLEKQISIFDAT